MSFAEEVKNEIAHYKTWDAACRNAELSALLWMGGEVLRGSRGQLGIAFTTSHNAVARRVLQMWRQAFSIRPEVRVRKGLRLRKRNYYIVQIPPSAAGAAALQALAVWPENKEAAPLSLTGTEVQRAFLRGAFMGNGSVNQPKGDYHLEIVTTRLFLAKVVLRLMKRFHLPARMTDRKGAYLVYIKEGNGVADFLQQIGATQAYLQFESVRVVKEMRNNVNRVVNCETANLQKTVDAAVKQRRNIEILQAVGKYGKLSLKLQEAAELRLANPEATLSELAAKSGLTKSGLSHRFKKIALWAENEGQHKNEKK